MKRPIVGVISNSYLVDDSYPVQLAGTSNLEALYDVSKVFPVIFPGIPELCDTNEICENFDGILLTGARPNIHPEEYGEEETLEHGQFDLNRDAVSLPLVLSLIHI